VRWRRRRETVSRSIESQQSLGDARDDITAYEIFLAAGCLTQGRGREPPVHATISIMLYVSHCRAPLTNGSRYHQRRWRAAFFTGQMSIPWPFQRQSSGLRAFDIISADTWA
jgi:hypothetical protein